MSDRTSADAPIDRAFAILGYVASQKKAVSIAEIATELGLPMASAHRLVGSLEARQLVQKAPGSKRFVVGNRLVTLAGKTIGSAFRTSRRHAVLEGVAREIGEQCEIGIVQNNRVIYVDSVRVKTGQGLQFDPGEDAPLHCTSTGKIYMSSLPAAARTKLVAALDLRRFTSGTITDAQQLLDVLARVRKQRWASSNEEFVQGVVGCAVPILSPSGTLMACLGVSVPTARVTFEELHTFIPPLTRAAQLLSETILQGEDAEADW